MTILAILLWLLVFLTLAWNFGWLNGLARVPGVAGFFGFMSASRGQPENVNEPGPRGQLSDADRQKLFAEAFARLSALEGIGPTKDDIMDRLISPAEEDSNNPFGTQAPALVALFSGPSGTGKSTAAIASAHMLTGKHAVETANIVSVRATDLRSGQHGGAAQLGRIKAEQAVGGSLLIEDAGWLLEDDGYGGRGPAADFGTALLDVLRQHPQRVFVAMTASSKDASRLRNSTDVQKWLSKLTIREVSFEDLSDDTLVELLERRLEDAGWELEDDAAADQAFRLMREVRERAGGSFDNAESCRRVAEQLVELVRSEGEDEAVRRKVISREALQQMDNQLE